MGLRLCAMFCLIAGLGLGAWGCGDSVEPSPACPMTVTPQAFTPCVIGGALTASISAPLTCEWRVSSTASWLSIVQGASGRGPGTVSAAYSANYDAPREGTLAIQVESPPVRHDVRVSQAGCRYSALPAYFGFEAGGGTGTIQVVQQTDPYECGGPKQDACQWSAVTDASWIAITTAMPQAGDQPVRFAVAPATTTLPRLGTIVIRDRIVTVIQTGR